MPPERLTLAIETNLPDAEQPDDNAGMQNAAQCVSVAMLRNDGQRRGRAVTIDRLGRRKRHLPEQAGRPSLTTEQPAVGLRIGRRGIGSTTSALGA